MISRMPPAAAVGVGRCGAPQIGCARRAGTKSKPGNPRYDLTFTNSDIRLVELFVRFVETTGRSRHELRYRVAIHEDVEETPPPDHADRRRGGVPGCLVVRVPRSRDLYLWMTGAVEGMVAASAPDPRPPEADGTR
ncbi:hypothetical protein ACGFI5_01960 [Micromonospora tulbaghiae]|uniref:WYL domain-containing protein n=1 Tax=Micromonospora tulbaghiae TaxID=479978 RepID=A0ABY0KH73_9ACTN|nr:hypothetical protein [Micromonospora tulbaghiae]MDX5456256.1 hypothetical protein [Micromonospora tulbaghiae]SCE70046.1 hypothetical protein GA0070562_1877 [Micromonospora tulbaghiae]